MPRLPIYCPLIIPSKTLLFWGGGLHCGWVDPLWFPWWRETREVKYGNPKRLCYWFIRLVGWRSWSSSWTKYFQWKKFHCETGNLPENVRLYIVGNGANEENTPTNLNTKNLMFAQSTWSHTCILLDCLLKEPFRTCVWILVHIII